MKNRNEYSWKIVKHLILWNSKNGRSILYYEMEGSTIIKAESRSNPFIGSNNQAVIKWITPRITHQIFRRVSLYPKPLICLFQLFHYFYVSFLGSMPLTLWFPAMKGTYIPFNTHQQCMFFIPKTYLWSSLYTKTHPEMTMRVDIVP